MPKSRKIFFVYRILNKEKCFFYKKRAFLRKVMRGGLNKKRNEGFLIALVMEIKKDPTMLIRKNTNELKVHKKTVRTAIKQDLSPDFNFLDDAICDVLKNKINTTSHSNIDSLKTNIDEKWNKMSVEFISPPKMAAILSKFTVLYLFLFCCLFKKIKINLVYFYTRIFLILLPCPVAFINGPGDLRSIPGRVISKTQKMVLDASLLNTQQYKVEIKSKVEQSRERSCALSYTSVL